MQLGNRGELMLLCIIGKVFLTLKQKQSLAILTEETALPHFISSFLFWEPIICRFNYTGPLTRFGLILKASSTNPSKLHHSVRKKLVCGKRISKACFLLGLSETSVLDRLDGMLQHLLSGVFFKCCSMLHNTRKNSRKQFLIRFRSFF